MFDFGQPLTIEEAWFVVKTLVKNTNGEKMNMMRAKSYAKVWAAHSKLGCTYDNGTMSCILELEKNLNLGAI
jgi:hypothetical protein